MALQVSDYCRKSTLQLDFMVWFEEGWHACISISRLEIKHFACLSVEYSWQGLYWDRFRWSRCHVQPSTHLVLCIPRYIKPTIGLINTINNVFGFLIFKNSSSNFGVHDLCIESGFHSIYFLAILPMTSILTLYFRGSVIIPLQHLYYWFTGVIKKSQ